eukprot:3819423-Prymnesium_polylepis.1
MSTQPLGRTGRRATPWAAHGDYLLVLSSTRISCQRHRRARVASVTAPGRIIGSRRRIRYARTGLLRASWL